MLYEGGFRIESIRNYIIAVISAAIICTIIIKITENRGSISMLMKILTGIFLATTVFSPIVNISFMPLSEYFEDIQTDASFFSTAGVLDAHKEKEALIKKRLETYIVDKANAMNFRLEAQVKLNEELIPVSVTLQANASPYYRKEIETYITDMLGIPKEGQQWI